VNEHDSKKRRRSIRLRGYDYTRPGAYAITISSLRGDHSFGQVLDGEMRLNVYGEIVRDCWKEIPAHFPHATLDTFVVMPNHLHGIILIEERVHDGGGFPRRGTACRAPTEQFGKPVPGSLPTMVRSFKSAVTRRINQQRGTVGGRVWQQGYYEHVIRDQQELDKFRRYILENPLKWDLDRESPNGLRMEGGS
jgi:putative transposase